MPFDRDGSYVYYNRLWVYGFLAGCGCPRRWQNFSGCGAFLHFDEAAYVAKSFIRYIKEHLYARRLAVIVKSSMDTIYVAPVTDCLDYVAFSGSYYGFHLSALNVCSKRSS